MFHFFLPKLVRSAYVSYFKLFRVRFSCVRAEKALNLILCLDRLSRESFKTVAALLNLAEFPLVGPVEVSVNFITDDYRIRESNG